MDLQEVEIIKNAYAYPLIANQVTRKDICKLHDDLSDKPYTANRVTASVSKMYNQAKIWELCDGLMNPCMGIILDTPLICAFTRPLGSQWTLMASTSSCFVTQERGVLVIQMHVRRSTGQNTAIESDRILVIGKKHHIM